MKIFWFTHKNKVLITCILTFVILLYGLYHFNSTDQKSNLVIKNEKNTVYNASDIETIDIDSELISSLECIYKKEHATKSLLIDDELNNEAYDILLELQNDISLDIRSSVSGYQWWTTITIDDTSLSCTDTHLVAATQGIHNINTIGLAVLPAQGYTPASVLIIGEENP